LWGCFIFLLTDIDFEEAAIEVRNLFQIPDNNILYC
jgi:hypothetical protein